MLCTLEARNLGFYSEEQNIFAFNQTQWSGLNQYKSINLKAEAFEQTRTHLLSFQRASRLSQLSSEILWT